MRDLRSSSQILFGYLPHQTVDVRGGVWKVEDWSEPNVERNVDLESLRREVCRLASPWRASQMDGNLVSDLETHRAQLQVVSVDKERGVFLKQFPRVWQCRNNGCHRIFDRPDTQCPCGDTATKGQLPFVMYCSQCGEIRQPAVPRCPTHGMNVRVVYPGTSTANEIRFMCAAAGCGRVVRQGLGFARCQCGNNLTPALHRAASVYTPRAVVLVNPPSPEKIRRLRGVGGPRRALEWVVEGMNGQFDVSRVSAEGLRRQLLEQGLSPEVVDAMLKAAEDRGHNGAATSITIRDDSAREKAEAEAVTIALALSESRTTIQQKQREVEPFSELGILYNDKYPAALGDLGLEAIDLIDSFPVLTGHYGYTRGDPEPGLSRLRGFRDRGNTYRIYADLAETEALFVRLDPLRVARWLRLNGFDFPLCSDSSSARAELLRVAIIPEPGTPRNQSPSIGNSILSLVHSYCHRFIRTAAVFAGIDRNSLSELLVPCHLGFFVYAAARGDFILGGLQAVFDSELDQLLRSLLSGERLCALDPGCERSGAACAACMHLGEPSCRYFNGYLSRELLFGPNGYLTESAD